MSTPGELAQMAVLRKKAAQSSVARDGMSIPATSEQAFDLQSATGIDPQATLESGGGKSYR